jgi:hypothetical protein
LKSISTLFGREEIKDVTIFLYIYIYIYIYIKLHICTG